MFARFNVDGFVDSMYGFFLRDDTSDEREAGIVNREMFIEWTI